MVMEARVTVTHRCMHAGVYTVRGSRSEQGAQVARLRLLECPHCRGEATTARAAADAERLGLPALVGTHGQIAEALRIRAHHLRKVAEAVRASYIQQAIARADGPLAPDARERIETRATPAGERAALSVLAPLLDHRDACWWIETRDLELDEVLMQAIAPSRAANGVAAPNRAPQGGGG